MDTVYYWYTWSADTYYSQPGMVPTQLTVSDWDDDTLNIWLTDGSGNDSFDLSGYQSFGYPVDVSINLAPGSWSTFSGSFKEIGWSGNVYIDPNTIIENAVGGTGNDLIYGNNWGNALNGWSGNDEIIGWGGDDTVFGDLGNDRCLGGSGNDLIYGGDGTDTIHGGFGNAQIVGGFGTDHLYGGNRGNFAGYNGNDTFIFFTNEDAQSDVIFGFEGPGRVDILDRIDVSFIDAFASYAGDQAFRFGSTAEGGLWVADLAGTTYTVVYINNDRDAQFDAFFYVEDGAVVASQYHRLDFVL